LTGFSSRTGSRIHRYDIVSSSGARYMGVRGFQKA
jgi:hypothetical protein